METLQKDRSFKILALFIFVFAVATVLSGGRALFTDIGRAAMGDVVPVVLWFNFIAGFFYFAAGVAIFKQHPCAKKVSTLLAVTSSLVLIFLGFHIFSGKPYEIRTLVAMTFRAGFWIFVALALFKSRYLRSSAST